MDKVSFDGANKIISVLTGVTNIDVGPDIYSAWKNWIVVDDNLKFLPALRTVGGDPTNPNETQFSPRYYFLMNGWRVHVDGQTVIVQMNLYTDEGDSPFIVTNNGAVTNRGSDAPISVTELPEIQYASYSGGVSFDPNSPYSGTEFPVGTPLRPVNNIPDAGMIAFSRGFNKGYLLSFLDMDDSVPLQGFTMIGQGGQKTMDTLRPEAIVYNCTFVECFVQGQLDGNCRLTNCIIGELNLGFGFLDRCILFDCYSDITAQSPPTIDCGGDGQALVIRNYNGTLKLINKTGPEHVSIDLNSGKVAIDTATVTAGRIGIRGIGLLIDHATKLPIVSGTYGSLIIENELVNTHSIAEGVWRYER